MLTHFEEKALEAYFSAECLTHRFLGDSESLFDTYCKIFLLSEESAQKIKEIAFSKQLKDIQTPNDYFRYSRLKQYTAIISDSEGISDEYDEAISLKYKAVTEVLDVCDALRDPHAAKSLICESIVQAADFGHIIACYTLGILQIEGILFDKDIQTGIARLQKSADWLSLEGLFASLYYGVKGERRSRYIYAVYEELQRTGNKRLFEKVKAVYGDYTKNYEEVNLLEKAFNYGKVKRETYSKPHSRLVFSNVLTKNKAMFLLTSNQALFESACSLPLKLSDKSPQVDSEVFESSLVPAYSLTIGAKLKGTEAVRSDCKPLCIVSDSHVLLEYFAGLVTKSLKGTHIEQIDMGDMNDCDFIPTDKNVFVCSCDEEKANVYLLFFEGEIQSDIFDRCGVFLQRKKRAKFMLNEPGATLDLSSIVPICFSDKQNAKTLQEYCEILDVGELSKSERAKFIDYIVESKRALFESEEIKTDKEVLDRLGEYDIDTIELIVGECLAGSADKRQPLTVENLQPYMSKYDTHNYYGFGGIKQ